MFFVFYFYQKNIQNLTKKVLVHNRLNTTSHAQTETKREGNRGWEKDNSIVVCTFEGIKEPLPQKHDERTFYDVAHKYPSIQLIQVLTLIYILI